MDNPSALEEDTNADALSDTTARGAFVQTGAASLCSALKTFQRLCECRAELYTQLKSKHEDVLKRTRAASAYLNKDRADNADEGEEEFDRLVESVNKAEENHRKCLNSFALGMNEINRSINESVVVVAVESKANANDDDDDDEFKEEREVIKALIMAVQECEKEKLRLTTIMMALKAHYAENKWSWQRRPNTLEEEEEEEEENDNDNDNNDNDNNSNTIEDKEEELKPKWATMINGDKNDAYAGARGGKCCVQAPEPTREEFENAMKEATKELELCVQKINDALLELMEIRSSISID
jgi:hypothetical protein